MTIYWKAVEQYFVVVRFAFQFSPACNFGRVKEDVGLEIREL